MIANEKICRRIGRTCWKTDHIASFLPSSTLEHELAGIFLGYIDEDSSICLANWDQTIVLKASPLHHYKWEDLPKDREDMLKNWSHSIISTTIIQDQTNSQASFFNKATKIALLFLKVGLIPLHLYWTFFIIANEKICLRIGRICWKPDRKESFYHHPGPNNELAGVFFSIW